MRIVRLQEPYLLIHNRPGSFALVLRSVDSLACLRRHIVLIVLRENLIGIEDAVAANVTLRYAAFAFLKKVRKNSTSGCNGPHT